MKITRSYRNEILVLIIYILANSSVLAQGEKARTSKCDLTISQSPLVGGLQLGMSVAQVKNIYPNIGSMATTDARKDRIVSTAQIQYLDLYDKPELKGITRIALTFVDLRLTHIYLEYDQRTSWKSVDEFAEGIFRSLSLPAACENKTENMERMRTLTFSDFFVHVALRQVFMRLDQGEETEERKINKLEPSPTPQVTRPVAETPTRLATRPLVEILESLSGAIAGDSSLNNSSLGKQVTEKWEPIRFDGCNLIWKHTRIETDNRDNEGERAISIATVVEQIGVRLANFDASSVNTGDDGNGRFAVTLAPANGSSIKVNYGWRSLNKTGWENPRIKEVFKQETKSETSIWFGGTNTDNRQNAAQVANFFLEAINQCQNDNTYFDDSWLANKVTFPPEKYTFTELDLSLGDTKQQLKNLFDQFGDSGSGSDASVWRLIEDSAIRDIRQKIDETDGPNPEQFDFIRTDSCTIWLSGTFGLYSLPLRKLKIPSFVDGNGKNLELRTQGSENAITTLLVTTFENSSLGGGHSTKVHNDVLITFSNPSTTRKAAYLFAHAIKLCKQTN